MIEHCLECKFTPGIPCTFVQFGCQFVGKRSQIDNHMKTCVNKHLTLTTAKINQQENKINQQENKINQQDDKIKQQENKINQQDNKINQQENKINQQDNKINQQENKISQQENKINQQENKINQQENKINQQENKINQQENKIKQQENKFNYKKNKFKEQEKKIKQQENKIKQQENMMTNKLKEINDRIERVFDMNKTKDVKLNNLEIKIKVLQENNKNLQIQYAEIAKINQDLKKQHEELQKVNKELKINHEKLQGKFDFLQSDFDNKDNIFSWKILNYQKNFRNAQNKDPNEIYSPAFYTSHGYKFKLCAYLNGHGSGEKTHTGLYFCLCKCVNDDALEWPFNKKYTLTIVSQNDRVDDETLTVVPAEDGEDAKGYFTKPTTDKNNGWGCGNFLPHPEKENYIKDDTMVIKCVIDC